MAVLHVLMQFSGLWEINLAALFSDTNEVILVIFILIIYSLDKVGNVAYNQRRILFPSFCYVSYIDKLENHNMKF